MLCRTVRVQLSEPSVVVIDTLQPSTSAPHYEMSHSRVSRKTGDCSGSSESDTDSNATVLERTASDGQGAPLLAPTTEPGPVGVPPEIAHPQRTSGFASEDWGPGDTAVAVNTRHRGYTPPTAAYTPQTCPKCFLSTVFQTRNSLANHLKHEHNTYMCSRTGVCYTYHRRGKRGAPSAPSSEASASNPPGCSGTKPASSFAQGLAYTFDDRVEWFETATATPATASGRPSGGGPQSLPIGPLHGPGDR